MARARNESKLTKRIKDYLNSLDECYCWKVLGGAGQQRGVSDLQVCYHGKYIALEVKDPNNSRGATKYQKLFLLRIKKAGGEAYVVRSLAAVKKRFT